MGIAKQIRGQGVGGHLYALWKRRNAGVLTKFFSGLSGFADFIGIRCAPGQIVGVG
jgi:hypothetical protein